MTSQDHATLALLDWQANRHLPPAARLAVLPPPRQPANSNLTEDQLLDHALQRVDAAMAER